MHNPDEQKYVISSQKHNRITLAVDLSLVVLDISRCEKSGERERVVYLKGDREKFTLSAAIL